MTESKPASTPHRCSTQSWEELGEAMNSTAERVYVTRSAVEDVVKCHQTFHPDYKTHELVAKTGNKRLVVNRRAVWDLVQAHSKCACDKPC